MPVHIFNGRDSLSLAGIVVNTGSHFVAVVPDKIKGMYRVIDDLQEEIDVWQLQQAKGRILYPFVHEVVGQIHTDPTAARQAGRLICEHFPNGGLCSAFLSLYGLDMKTVQEVMKAVGWKKTPQGFLLLLTNMNQVLSPTDVKPIIEVYPLDASAAFQKPLQTFYAKIK